MLVSELLLVYMCLTYDAMHVLTKNITELNWISHGVMRFRFLLNFLLISAFFDILASLSISHAILSGISGR